MEPYLHDKDLPHLALERAVMGKGHVSTVVGEVADGGRGGAVPKDAVLNLEDLLGEVRLRHHHHVEETHPEVEESAIRLDELGQAVVGQLVHHEHVPDDRQPPRTRRVWKPLQFAEQEAEVEERDDEEGDGKWLETGLDLSNKVHVLLLFSYGSYL